MFNPDLGEADPGGLGACPQVNNHLFFSRKEAKALVLLRRRQFLTKSSAKSTQGVCPQVNNHLFFSRKETKALVLLRRRQLLTQSSAKPTQRVWGLAPSKQSSLLFQKRSKSVGSASQKTVFNQVLGEVDQGDCPQVNNRLFFSRKETKALVLLRRRQFSTQSSAKPTQGVWGLAPKKRLSNWSS
jgi:hypothetical protein